MNIGNKRGITLVALVITIIILLILAGVAITTLTQTGLFENAKQAKQKSKNAQELENVTLANYENKIDSTVNGSRDTVTISKEEYQELKEEITPKEIDFQLTIPYTKLYRKEAYVIGSEVHIYINMNCSINNDNETIIGKVPEQYKPIKDENILTNFVNAVYLYSNNMRSRVGVIWVDDIGNIVIGNWCGSAMEQVGGSLTYRYK
jgi:hypothetical protein